MIKTLLVDGDNLFKIGYHGVKEFYHNGKHIGGIYHFINTIRRFLVEQNYDKVVVFWDDKDNSSNRKILYPKYKEQRNSFSDELKEESFYEQRQRVKEYLEEMFVRQVSLEKNEADDLIAYYCHISDNEEKTIFSGDKDLTQLISDNVTIYSPNSKRFYKSGDTIKLRDIEVPHKNVKLCKILMGDSSDNIDGIYFLGEKTFVKLFPEVLEHEVYLSDILTKAENLLKEDKENKVLQNLLTGKTKTGIYGNEFFEINEKIVDLSNPMITDEGKVLVESYYNETLDPDGRGHKNLIRMMMNDGIFKYLPKHDNAWIDFIKPFLKLTRKEKNNYKTKKPRK